MAGSNEGVLPAFISGWVRRFYAAVGWTYDEGEAGGKFGRAADNIEKDTPPDPGAEANAIELQRVQEAERERALQEALAQAKSERDEQERREAEARAKEIEDERLRLEAEAKSRAAAEWTRRMGTIEDPLKTLLSGGIGDVGAMRAALADTTAKAHDEDHIAALVSLARLEALVSDGSELAGSALEKTPGAFAAIKAQKEWILVRKNVAAELGRLGSVIITTALRDDEMKPVVQAAGGLASKLVPIGATLDQALSDIAAADPASRAGAIEAARLVVASYRQTFDDPFFRAVEAGTGFGAFPIRQTALDGLERIEKALA